jgi:hypothetical protein
MAHFKGRAEATMAVPVTAIWREAVELEWLSAWDDVRLQGSPRPQGRFTVTDELRSFSGRFTTFEPPADPGSRGRLGWTVDDGSSGTLALTPTATGTHATLTDVSVPHGLDRVLTLAVSVVPGKARRLSDEGCAMDLRALKTKAASRARGRLYLGREMGMVRQMAAQCPYGWDSADPDSLPEFDESGQLKLEPGEAVLTTTVATVLSTAAKGAHGREQFKTLWRSDDAAVTLTDRRLTYQVRGPVEAGDVLAGHIRHAHVANLILGDGDAYGLPDLGRVTATLLEPPEVGIRVHLLTNDAPDLARQWVRVIATWRLARYPDHADPAHQDGQTLRAQVDAPDFADGFWGPLARLPLHCPLGSTDPFVRPQKNPHQ